MRAMEIPRQEDKAISKVPKGIPSLLDAKCNDTWVLRAATGCFTSCHNDVTKHPAAFQMM